CEDDDINTAPSWPLQILEGCGKAFNPEIIVDTNKEESIFVTGGVIDPVSIDGFVTGYIGLSFLQLSRLITVIKSNSNASLILEFLIV
ncbi:MAG: hypothetical protein JWP67_3013, partial [Mucilaginibacter sp.]|nr:hypothetical protein [Mucilaginibacter sp.]